MTEACSQQVAIIKRAIVDDLVSVDVAQALAEMTIESMVEANKALMEDEGYEGALNMLTEEHIRECADDYIQDALADLTIMVRERIKATKFAVNAKIKTTVKTSLRFE